MKLFSSKKFGRESGVTLIEIMIATGLVSLISIAIVTVLSTGSKGQKAIQSSDDSRTLTNDIASILSSSAACLNTFSLQNPVTGSVPTQIRATDNSIRYQTTSIYGNRTLILSSLALGGAGTDTRTGLVRYTASSATQGTALLLINWQTTGTANNKSGPATLTRYVLISVTLNGSNQITACQAQAGGSTASGTGTPTYFPLWQTSSTLADSTMSQTGSSVTLLGRLGIGMSPVSPHLLQMQSVDNNGVGGIITNNSTGAAASSYFMALNNAGRSVYISQFGTGYTPTYASQSLANWGYLGTSALSSGLMIDSGATGPMNFVSNGQQRMTITNGGNVGIGTTNPGTTLAVAGSFSVQSTGLISTFGSNVISSSYSNYTKGGTGTVVGRIGTDGGAIISGGSGDHFGIRAENDLLLMAGTSERARITASGYFGIGTTGAIHRLDVRNPGGGASWTGRIESSDLASNAYFAHPIVGSYGSTTTNSGYGVQGVATNANGIGVYGQAFGNPGTGVYGYVNGIGSVGSYGLATRNDAYAALFQNTGSGYYCYMGYLNTYALICNGPNNIVSDGRLKKNIRTLGDAEGLTAVMALNPVRYNWKDKKKNQLGHDQFGFIAQEVEKVVPDLVGIMEQSKYTNEEGVDGPIKVLNYEGILPLIVKAIQNLMALIQGLLNDTDALKKENAAMKAYLCAKDPTAPFCNK